MTVPLLTIAIPTWNRAPYLKLNLQQLHYQITKIPAGKVELIVSDNASTDNTAVVVAEAKAQGMAIDAHINRENIGSDANIAQCYNLARGKYVIALGDDDLFVDGALEMLLRHLESDEYGVVIMRPYGYDADFRCEFPGAGGCDRTFTSVPNFLAATRQLMALISACVINKSLLPQLDATKFCGGSLVQTHLVLSAALAARKNLYMQRYMIAYKRNNWGPYDFAGILVTSLTNILDSYTCPAMTSAGIAKIENKLILGFYPFYIFSMRLRHSKDLDATRAHFEKRFKGRWLYDFGIAPIFNWPRPLALVWGAGITFIGRTLNGDLRRGVLFAFNKAYPKMNPECAPPLQISAMQEIGSGSPLLTIAIPTWNRGAYLAMNLEQLERQLPHIPLDSVEIIVSNNASQDNTDEVVRAVMARGMSIHYKVNADNIGSDANLAQCFNLARGKYVIILGDDDLIVDGGLKLLINHLIGHDYGTVTIRPYGYDHDFRTENPGGTGRDRVFHQAPAFLAAIGPWMTLISACVINKSLLPGVDATQFCGTNLVQMHLVLRAALVAYENLFLDHYLVACKRNNSGGYHFAAVFVTSFAGVLDHYRGSLLSGPAIDAIERKMLIVYFPHYLFLQRLKRTAELEGTREHFEKRFKGRLVYNIIIVPILFWPRPLALLWGGAMACIGRVLNGDLRRGLMFIRNKIRQR